MRVLLALALAVSAGPACGRPRAPRFDPPASAGPVIGSLLSGPLLRPGNLVIADEAGRLRSLELDDLAPLHLRVTIPF